MPQAGPAIAAFLGKVTWQTWASVAIMAASAAYSYWSAEDESAWGQPTQAFQDPGLKVNTRSTSAPVRVVYGLQKVGGNDVYLATSGSNNEYLWIVQTLSEGECNAINTDGGADQVWLGDNLESAFGSLVNYWFHGGSGSQTVDTNLNTAVPAWTDCLRNTCYIVFKLEFSRNYFQSMPRRQVELQGKKVYDFRDTVTKYSNNPVLCLYDYMTSTRYGVGISSTKLDTTTWTSAANYCDTKSWELNMVVTSDEAAGDVINNMLAHFRGTLVWYDDTYYLRYADLNDESSLMTLEDKHISQDENGKADVTITQPSRFARPDAVRVNFIDPDKNYVTDDILIGDDTGVVKDLKLLGCTDREQAANLGVYKLERWQLDRMIIGRFRDDALQLEPHDLITFNSTALSISSQLMRVVDANILPTGLIELALAYESLDLYDDDYDLISEGTYTCTLPDPTSEPPSITNVAVSESTYDYRLRHFTRLKITFDEPASYNWFDHIEVWISYDDVTWEHIFDCTDDFEIANIEEGVTYYIRMKVVSIWGTKQQDSNDYKVVHAVGGWTTAPGSLTSLKAIVNASTINLYATKVSDPDVETYEFRIGSGWSGGIFLAALRAPNLSLYGVKPGSHTFLANTLSNNGLYGSTPRSASATLKDPPDNWTVQDTEAIDTLITNGDMELTTNWADVGTPTANARSAVQKHDGSYSRLFTVDAANEGIQGDAFTTVTSADYGWSAWVYPDDATSVRVKIRKGDDSGFIVDSLQSGLDQDAWNFIYGTYTETAGGAGAYIIFECDTATSGDWYIDDACLMRGTFSNAAPVLYDSDAYIRCAHNASLSGTYTSHIVDQSSSGRYLVYVLGDIISTGGGTTWDDIVPSPDTWEDMGEDQTWSQILTLSEGPAVAVKLQHGDASPPTNDTEKLEILSCIETARYYRIVISFTDPSNQVYGMHGAPTIKWCQ